MSGHPPLPSPVRPAAGAGAGWGLLFAGVVAAASATALLTGRVGLGVVLALLAAAVGAAPWDARRTASTAARPLTRDGATVLLHRPPDRRMLVFLVLLTLDVVAVLVIWGLSDSPPSEHRVRAAVVVLAALGLALVALRELTDLRAGRAGEVELAPEWITLRHRGGASARLRWDDVLAIVGYTSPEGTALLAFETDRAVVRRPDGRERDVAPRDLGAWTTVRAADLAVDPERVLALAQHYVLYPRDRVVELGTPAAIVRFQS